MRFNFRPKMKKIFFLGLVIFAVSSGVYAGPAENIPVEKLLEPQVLAAHLATTTTAKAPLLLQVGFRTLYVQAHIPKSVYAGPGNSNEGLKRLEGVLKKTGKKQAIVLYCGCCPWSHCPNIAAALKKTTDLGFKNVKVLHMDHDFGKDWADAAYPVEAGE